MTYVITQRCVGIKDSSCVAVCPVDCIKPLPEDEEFGQVDQLYIDPDTCIECGACMPACPNDAIFADEDVPEEYTGDIAANADYFLSKS
ncbi:ferredoxin family protein [Rhodococcus sp. NPDC019627]|uniref:4Fe-4S dicluster domain-containing protein n=1 Tax=unclassified Rhodococcus (in: high G+C Gram-positive bacteria) TaxID=192944 RepID=UPI0034059CCA